MYLFYFLVKKESSTIDQHQKLNTELVDWD